MTAPFAAGGDMSPAMEVPAAPVGSILLPREADPAFHSLGVRRSASPTVLHQPLHDPPNVAATWPRFAK